MKTISSIILGIFISNLILAQQRTNSTHQFLHLDTILFMPKEKQWMSGFKPLVCEWNNTLIFTNYNIFQKNDSIHVYFLNLFDNSIDNISLFYNGINKTFEKQNNFCFSCISFNGKYLVLGFYTYLLIYEKINNEFVFKKKIEFKHSFNDCWFVDDNRLFLTYMYN